MRSLGRRIGLVGMVFALLSWAPGASAAAYGFTCLTGNRAGDCAIGEAQLSVEVQDLDGGLVRFLFANSGPSDSSISEIYFDDGSLLALSSVINGPGVNFKAGANPPNLPGGNLASPPFVVTQGFLAESVPPPPHNGVRPGEWVAIDFSLQGSQTYTDVLSQLGDGTLRIGIHVIAFASGGSESFIHVPEPALGSLIGLALLALGPLRRVVA